MTLNDGGVMRMRFTCVVAVVVVGMMALPLAAGSARGGGAASPADRGQARGGSVAQPAITIVSPPRPPVQYQAPVERPAAPVVTSPPTAPPPPVTHPPRSPEPRSRGEHELRRMVTVYPTPVWAGDCPAGYSSSSSSSSSVVWDDGGDSGG